MVVFFGYFSDLLNEGRSIQKVLSNEWSVDPFMLLIVSPSGHRADFLRDLLAGKAVVSCFCHSVRTLAGRICSYINLFVIEPVLRKNNPFSEGLPFFLKYFCNPEHLVRFTIRRVLRYFGFDPIF